MYLKCIHVSNIEKIYFFYLNRMFSSKQDVLPLHSFIHSYWQLNSFKPVLFILFRHILFLCFSVWMLLWPSCKCLTLYHFYNMNQTLNIFSPRLTVNFHNKAGDKERDNKDGIGHVGFTWRNAWIDWQHDLNTDYHCFGAKQTACRYCCGLDTKLN